MRHLHIFRIKTQGVKTSEFGNSQNIYIHIKFKSFSIETITIKFLGHKLNEASFIIVHQVFDEANFAYLSQGGTDQRNRTLPRLK